LFNRVKALSNEIDKEETRMLRQEGAYMKQWHELNDYRGKYSALHEKLIMDNRAAKAREEELKKRIEELESQVQ
jgi:hypothetical protein